MDHRGIRQALPAHKPFWASEGTQGEEPGLSLAEGDLLNNSKRHGH